VKLAKSFGLALSIATSGGVMLILSGSAYAADSGVNTTSQSVNQDTTTSTATTLKSRSSSVVNVVVDSKGSAVSNGSTESQLSGTSQNTQVSVAGIDDPSKTSTTSSVPISNTSQGSNPTAAEDPKITVSTNLSLNAAPSTGGALSKNSLLSASNDLPGVVFHSSLLAIQPRITTSHVTLIDDLASSVPTALTQQHDPAKLPTPSQPSNVLGRLTAVLAGSVVPHVFTTPGLGLPSLVVLLSLLAATILLSLRPVSLTFGALMRLGGYVHAARSDVVATMSIFFATPLNLSYVSAIEPTYSSFLVVSDNKTVCLNGFQRFQKGGK
jgi:hypothetical protein